MESPLSSRALILAALTEGPNFGLGIIQRVAERTGYAVDLLSGAAYPALRGLEREGLIVSKTEHRTTGGRPRRIYKLTKAGWAKLDQFRPLLRWMLESCPDPL